MREPAGSRFWATPATHSACDFWENVSPLGRSAQDFQTWLKKRLNNPVLLGFIHTLDNIFGWFFVLFFACSEFLALNSMSSTYQKVTTLKYPEIVLIQKSSWQLPRSQDQNGSGRAGCALHRQSREWCKNQTLSSLHFSLLFYFCCPGLQSWCLCKTMASLFERHRWKLKWWSSSRLPFILL